MRRFDQINVIPFIDIMLVLLAIVLTTATFIAQGRIEVNLPVAESGQAASSKPALMLSIDAQGQVYVDDKPVALDALTKRLETLPKSRRIVFMVDRATPFGRFVAVVDRIKHQGLTQLTIRTLPAS